jgi:hypothetical protein
LLHTGSRTLTRQATLGSLHPQTPSQQSSLLTTDFQLPAYDGLHFTPFSVVSSRVDNNVTQMHVRAQSFHGFHCLETDLRPIMLVSELQWLAYSGMLGG